MTRKSSDIRNYKPPSPERVWQMTMPMRKYFSPVFYGLENIKTGGPYLFIANHTIHGVLDLPLYAAELYCKKGIYLRGMADHFHYLIPIWRNVLEWMGAVRGTPENCSKLMKAGKNILILPGGGREVCRRSGEAYKLIWQQRTGFARMAIKHDYPILPIATIGIDNAFSILIDRDDIMNSPLGNLIRMTGIFNHPLLKQGEEIPPITRGIGLTPFPRPERVYVSFGEPIHMGAFLGRHEDKEAQLALRDIVANAINKQIRELLNLREQDTTLSLMRRFLTWL